MPILQEKLSTIILAAGVGKRMKSKTPKILHQILGKPVISFVLDLARDVGSSQTILVVSEHTGDFFESLRNSVCFAIQKKPFGTGDAATRGLERADHGDVLILCGDVPLLQRKTIIGLMEYHREQNADVTILTCRMNDPFGYGRIIRNGDGNVTEIIEQTDANSEQQKINEINAGVYYGRTKLIKSALKGLTADNKQREYYLTDAIHRIVKEGKSVAGYMIDNADEITGINTREHLARVRALAKSKWLRTLMERGVDIEDPATTNIDLSVEIGEDVRIRPYSFIEGKTTIRDGEIIGPFIWIKNGKVLYSANV
jgi:bifunctional UDP-N-acetylglucosamine pyrophosphorylase/glucosamine-1-phosphate N-acetyltransferase